MKILHVLAIGVAALLSLAPSLAHAETIEASSPTNPPPSERLDGFDRVEVSKILLPDAYAEKKVNKKALASLQENLDQRLADSLAEWNGRTPKNDPPRRLLVEPRVEKIRFISGGARFWAGAFAGKSALLMRVRLTDAATGTVIAEPEFFQHAAAMSGAWTVGGADNAMLARTTTLIADYLKANQAEAVGGPTSLVTEEETKSKK